jgi:hypothetical protein
MPLIADIVTVLACAFVLVGIMVCICLAVVVVLQALGRFLEEAKW